jgi:hypothetical protein
MQRSLAQAQKSTASLGRFDRRLPNEKEVKNQGKKRKVGPWFLAFFVER